MFVFPFAPLWHFQLHLYIGAPLVAEPGGTWFPNKGHLCELINNNGDCWGCVEHMGVTSIQVGQFYPLRIGVRPPSPLSIWEKKGFHQQVWSRKRLVNI